MRDKEKEREIFRLHVHCLNSHNNQVRPGQSQEAAMPSLSSPCVSGAQALGPSSVPSPQQEDGSEVDQLGHNNTSFGMMVLKAEIYSTVPQ